MNQIRRSPIGTEGDERRSPEAADTEGHVRFLLDEQGNPEVNLPDDGEDTEGHRRI
jgi:hypothetical protein